MILDKPQMEMVNGASDRLMDKLEEQIGQGGIKGNIFDEIKNINKELTARMAMKIDLRRENMVVESDDDDYDDSQSQDSQEA